MAQPQSRQRNVRLLPPGHAAPPTVGQQAAATTPDKVTLSDGRVVTLRRLNGLDSAELNQAMEEAGFTKLEGVGRATYLACRGLRAVLEIDGKMQTPFKTGAELKARLAGLDDADVMAIAGAYMRLVGEVPQQAQTFPAADSGSAQS